MLEWGPNEHYLKNAIAMSICSRAAYCALPGDDPDFQSLGLTRTERITCDETGTEGFAAWNDNVLVFAFRGTEPTVLKDWLTDLKFHMTTLADAEVSVGVHHGFFKSFESVRGRIRQLANTHLRRAAFITGHSLGAALATIAARDLQLRGISINGLYTFGSPRVGDKVFASTFPVHSVFRFVNEGDIVPLFPFDAILFADFHHAGQRNHMRGSAIHLDESIWQEVKARFGYLWMAKTGKYDGLIESALTDHFIAKYISHLRGIVAAY